MENIGSFDGTHTNTPEQKANYKVIKNCLDKYDIYPLNNELKNKFEHIEEIFSEETLIPELVIQKEIFNKNNFINWSIYLIAVNAIIYLENI